MKINIDYNDYDTKYYSISTWENTWLQWLLQKIESNNNNISNE